MTYETGQNREPYRTQAESENLRPTAQTVVRYHFAPRMAMSQANGFTDDHLRKPRAISQADGFADHDDLEAIANSHKDFTMIVNKK